MDQGQANNPKCNPLWLPNKILGFAQQDSYYSTHNRAKFSDWHICQTRDSLLVEMLSLISQQLCASSQLNFYRGQSFHIHIQQASHISCMNLQTYNIRATAQWE